jgi:hypothetical protein
MNKIIIITLLSFSSFFSFAESSLDKVVEPILKAIDAGEFTSLASMAFPKDSTMREYISTADIKQLDTQMESYLRTMGASNGYILHHKAEVSGVFELRYYLYKFDRQPVLVKFEVYKPKNSWEMHSISLDFNLDDYIEEGGKLFLGAKANPIVSK